MKKAIGIFTLVTLFLLSVVTVNAQTLMIGDTAKDFTLKNVDGSEGSLQKLVGSKGAIIVFTCNHCPFSKAYEDRIIALDKNFKGVGYPVIAINPNDPTRSPEDSYEKMQERSSEKGFPFPYLYDEKQEVAKAFGASNTPHVYLLSVQNKDLIVKYIGAIDDNSDYPGSVKEKYVENAINQLMADGKIAVQETKAIGCTIKWKR